MKKGIIKSIFALGLMATMAFSLSACSNDTAKPSEEVTPSQSVEPTEAVKTEEPTNNTDVPKKSIIEEIKERKVIVMCTNAEFEPFEYRVDGNKVEGFDVDIATKVAEKLGVELVIEDVNFGGLIPLLESGKADFIAAGFTYTEERAKNVDFSDTYFNAKQLIIVREDNNSITTIDDLKDKYIGGQLGTTGVEIAESDLGAKEVVSFDKAVSAVIDLQNDKLDAVILDSEPATKIVNANPGLKILDLGFADEEYVIAVKKGNTELVDVINEVLDEIRASGEYDELVDKYFNS